MEEMTEALKKLEENIINALKDNKPATPPPQINITESKTETDTVEIPTPPQITPPTEKQSEKTFLQKLDTFLFGR